jgi:hypothetical protein
MGNTLTAQVTITGARPLLWHAFGPDAIPLTKRERSGVAGNDPEEWRRTVLAAADRRLYLGGSYVFGALRDGARFTRKGRGTLQPAVASTLQVADVPIFLIGLSLPEPLTTDPTQPVYLDVRSVKNPTTKARNVRYRIAAAPGWALTVAITWDKTVVSRGEMEAVTTDAGRLVGIGSGRAIGMGRFEVTAFEIDSAA